MELRWLLLGQWLDNGFHMYTETFDYTGPLAVFIYKYVDFIFGRSAFAHHALNAIVIIIQAGIFNQLLLKNKAFNESSYLPAFLYMLLVVSVPDFMSISPQLFSVTFILLALKNVLRRIDNQVTDELFLKSGISVGIATMIYLPSAVFFLVFLFSLILFSTAITRRVLLYLFGFLLIFSLTFLYYYWSGDHYVFLESFIIESLKMRSSMMLTLVELLILSAGFLFLLVISVVKTLRSARLTNFQQKIRQVIWLMFLGATGTFFLSKEDAGLELVFFVPILAYFLTHYFLLLRKPLFQFIMPPFIILGSIAYSCISYQKWTSHLLVDKKDTTENCMVLGANLNYYTENDALSPCFNEHLSIRGFEGLDYYRSAIRLYEIISKANPDLIIDELGVANELFDRFPLLHQQYELVSEGKYRKISN